MFADLPNTIAEWESELLSNEKTKPPFIANHSLSSKLVWTNNSGIAVQFKGSYLKQDKVNFTPNSAVYLFIIYELDRWPQDLNTDFSLQECLLGALELTKNADPDKYSCISDRV